MDTTVKRTRTGTKSAANLQTSGGHLGSTQTLDQLHDEKMKQLEKGDTLELMEYLLNCQTYLKESDRDGWIKNFAPELLLPEPPLPPPKRMRRSPKTVVWKPLQPCIECKSNDVIEDVKEGSVVCTACGLIQKLHSITPDSAHMSMDRLKNGNRDVVHRYSRVVYFRSILLGIQGQTSTKLKPEDEKSLRQFAAGKNFDVTPTQVLKFMGEHKMPKRYKRHAEFITTTITNNKHKPPQLTCDELYTLLRAFRAVESWWNHTTPFQRNGRKNMFGIRPLIYQLCMHFEINGFVDQNYLLRNRRVMRKWHNAYLRCAKSLGYYHDTEAFYVRPKGAK